MEIYKTGQAVTFVMLSIPRIKRRRSEVEASLPQYYLLTLAMKR